MEILNDVLNEIVDMVARGEMMGCEAMRCIAYAGKLMVNLIEYTGGI